ncbi:hypothetical protein Val02_66260 [Virgisporangium aliadipatigenens]|uniref:Uncharacterized protein n=1 Tax=Virgisporangium aliadipatigenens TaxID=741659 RepID=A0A8J3YTQ6_9ACTN|nr:hypothetical protein [Virgisporangium aliadipatigenens]GIJ49740.1 hypothetical protein Val02_66260 [Virgisporangium aliadipatigenens]
MTIALRAVWTAMVLLTAAFVAVLAGLLTAAGGATLPNALLAGGVAFASTAGVLLAVLTLLLSGPQ